MSDLEHFAEFAETVLTTENGSPLVLEDFQRSMLAEHFEGVRELLILMDKKLGKSSLLAGRGLYELCTVPFAEVAIVAASREQAGLILKQARGYIQRSDALSPTTQREGIATTFGPISSRPGGESARAGPDAWVALAVLRPCLGCGGLIEAGSRCPRCQVRRPRGRRWRATRQLVFARYGRTCWRCGAPATDVDHLTPIADGGSDSLANLRPACARCNRGRQD